MADYLPVNFSDRLAHPMPEWERKLLELAGKTNFGPFLRCVLHRNDPAVFPIYFASKFLIWEGDVWGAQHAPGKPPAPVMLAPWDKIKDGCDKLANVLRFEQWEAEAFIGAIAMHMVKHEDLVSGARTLTGEAPKHEGH